MESIQTTAGDAPQPAPIRADSLLTRPTSRRQARSVRLPQAKVRPDVDRQATRALLGLAAVCAPLLGSNGLAADATPAVTQPKKATPAPAKGLLDKPAWLTDLSIGLKESYDNNVYGVQVGPLRNTHSWVTSVTPKVGVNLAPLLGDQKALQTLSLSYAPDVVRYHHAVAENYEAHRVASVIKGKAGPVSFNLDNAFNFVNVSAGTQNQPGMGG
jgi:hypothetical protein